MASLDRGGRHEQAAQPPRQHTRRIPGRARAIWQLTRTWATAARILPTEQPYLPHFGLIVATCERGDMRLSPGGILIHGLDGTREVAVPRGTGRPGQGDALDALWDAVQEWQTQHSRRAMGARHHRGDSGGAGIFEAPEGDRADLITLWRRLAGTRVGPVD